MKVSETFASAYLNADSLIHGDRNLQMGDVAREQMPGGRKPYVLGFLNSEQRLVINKAIADAIAALHGDDSDGWRGKWITVFRDETVRFEGKSAPGVRVRPTVPAGVGNSGLVALGPQDDSIPF
jgi:hypothetical protein